MPQKGPLSSVELSRSEDGVGWQVVGWRESGPREDILKTDDLDTAYDVAAGWARTHGALLIQLL